MEALGAEVGISSEWFLVHEHRPEDFLVVFARQEHRNCVGVRPSIDHKGVRLFFRQWNRQAQAVHTVMRFKVSLVLKGIPPHAWEREMAEDVLSSACLVDMVAPETSARWDLSAFKLSAWTSDPKLLQYKVLSHVDEVTEFDRTDEPWFLRASSSSGQSGILDAGSDSLGACGDGARSHTMCPHWRFGVRDQRGRGATDGLRGGAVEEVAAPLRATAGEADWRLPPMSQKRVLTSGGASLPIRDRLTFRTSAFDCLTTALTRVETTRA